MELDRTNCSSAADARVGGGAVDGDRLIRRFAACVGTFAAGLLAWWIAATFLVPVLIRLAHQGVPLPGLSQLMAGREDISLGRYLEHWGAIRRGGTLWLGLLGLMSLPIVFVLPFGASRVAGSVRPPGARGSWISAAILTAGIAGVCGLVPLLRHVDPVAYIFAITEDYWVEYGTFSAFSMAGLLFLWTALVRSGRGRLGPIVFAAAALFVGLEEISWGQRIIGFGTPEALETWNTQGETTLHNIWFPTRRITGIIVLGFAFALPWACDRWRPLDGWLGRLGVPVPPPVGRLSFVVAAGFFFASDFVSGSSNKLDEVAELALGLGLLVVGLHEAIRAGNGRSVADARILPAAASAGVIAALTTATLVSVVPNPQGLTRRLNDFAANRFPADGLGDQALELFEFMEERSDLRTDRTRIDYGRVLLARGDTARGETILRDALREQEPSLRTESGDSQRARRQRIEIFTLLGRPAEAAATLQVALERDRSRLETARLRSDSAEAYWSMARAFAASGDLEAAREHAAAACFHSDSRPFRRTIEEWLILTTDHGPGTPSPCETEDLRH